jgi:segregation and condensation protein B
MSTMDEKDDETPRSGEAEGARDRATTATPEGQAEARVDESENGIATGAGESAVDGSEVAAATGVSAADDLEDSAASAGEITDEGAGGRSDSAEGAGAYDGLMSEPSGAVSVGEVATPPEHGDLFHDSHPADATDGPMLPRPEVRAILEALIFASSEPITPREISHVLQGVPKNEWLEALDEVKAEYSGDGRGLHVVEVASGWQITTRPEYNDWVRELLDPKQPTRLSIQALETLAVIAYKQPVTLPEIIELRGVKSGGVIKTLLEKRLIRIVGRKEVVGRPILYGTTKHFLLHFGLKDLSELPKVEEFAEVLGEEVDEPGLRRALEAPTAVDVPLGEGEPEQLALPGSEEPMPEVPPEDDGSAEEAGSTEEEG